MDVKRKIKEMLKLRDEILLEAKDWDKSQPCPLNDEDLPMEEGNFHSTLAHLFSLQSTWEWECPFCGEEWED